MWTAALFSYLSLVRLGLNLSDQLVAPQFFISYTILVLAWALSGPIAAAILSLLAAVVSLYFSLSAREPAIFLQLFAYGALFVFMVSYLHKVQKNTNDQKIAREKIIEEIHLVEEASQGRDHLKRALEDKIARFLDLHRFSAELKDHTVLRDAAQKIVNEVRGALRKADECALYLVNESRLELSLIAGSRADGEAVREKEGSLFDRWVMKKSQAIMIEDAENDFRFPKEAAPESAPLRSVCASPLMTENKVLGVVRASSARPESFSADDLRLLDIFSSLGAVTLRNILLHGRMEELAIRDGLTGLYLNRYFQERLSEEILRSRPGNAPFSVMLIDIDYFKRYNDEFGHAAGDLVLRHIAALLLKKLESADLVARYGGEEFVVLLPGKGRKEAMAAAEKIRAEIEKTKFFVRRVENRVTASFGLAFFPKAGRTREELMWAADKSLYEAKNSGRNRVCGNS
ncbi:MAG: diguanylate cyclase [Candidatus Omnitrophota bacterium]